MGRTSIRVVAVTSLLAACAGELSSGNGAEEPAADGGGRRVGSGGASGSGRRGAFDGSAGPAEVPTAKDAGVLDTDAQTDRAVIVGAPGCGLEAAAFCDQFDAPATRQGRAGELDDRYWSAGRLAPQLTTGNGVAIGIGPGTVPSCRSGLRASALPSMDAFICDSSAHVGDRHLLVVAAAQNYGQNSYRIRQPFDFANRTGKVVFDAEGFVENQLIGWVSLDVTEDPVNAPSFSVGEGNNDEGSQWPRNGFEVQLQRECTMVTGERGFSLRFIAEFRDYVQVMHESMPTCIGAARGKLNHFELRVSQKKIEVYASPASEDGRTFGELQLLHSADVDLPFTRGYVHITTHNHASIKYADGLDAWTARWNNVGFDGPVIHGLREYSVPDALVAGEGAWNRPGPVVSIGYRLPDVASGPKEKLIIKGVDLSDVVSAKLSLSGWYPYFNENVRSLAIKYRLNDREWLDRPMTEGELRVLTDPRTQGQVMQMIDLPLAALVQGDNTLELVSVAAGEGYPAAVANIDLIFRTQ
jgi:hypothetical protein